MLAYLSHSSMSMKGRVIVGTLLGLVLCAALAPAEEPQKEIVFYVRIDKDKGGQVLCALYDDEKHWLSHHVFQTVKSSADRTYATCRFRRVPNGSYAIAALHDEDRDGEMDKFLGLPLEGYAASRDAHFEGIGAPDWEDAIFTHRTGTTLQRARMKY